MVDHMNLIILFFGLGTGEIILICLVVILLLGGNKIAGVMKGLGKGVKSVQDEVSDFQMDLDLTGTKNPKKEPKSPDPQKKSKGENDSDGIEDKSSS